MKALAFLLPAFLLSAGASNSIRIYPASKYTLVPESQAHLTFGGAFERALDPKSIKILVWNVKKGQAPGLDQDLPRIGKDRDLLLISEGFLNPYVRGIFDAFNQTRWDMGISFLYNRDHNYPTGTLIGSRVDPSWVKVKESVDLEPLFRTPKCLTMAKYPVANGSKELLVISIHGVNAVLPKALDRQLAFAQAEIAKHDGPVIFGGDFNTNLESKVQLVLKTAGDLGMQSVTFRNDERKLVEGNIIDYIFIRGMHVKDAEVLGKLTSSDHKAMLAELAID